ncbi:transcription elongation factor GreA [Candidatus Peregrinibacteria bacterium]|nr:transcription elongation factor GreA [Candidatus Peregrinibacteria bacterium]
MTDTTSLNSTITIGDDDKKTILVTKEGLKKLQDELDYLKNIRRREVADRLKEAISYGDLSENSEYEEAKNEQAFLEGRILELEDKIKFAKIIDDRHQHGATVQLGSRVRIRNLSNNDQNEYVVVGSTESDSLNNRISNESPVGKALLDRKIKDKIEVRGPSGTIFHYEILSIN